MLIFANNVKACRIRGRTCCHAAKILALGGPYYIMNERERASGQSEHRIKTNGFNVHVGCVVQIPNDHFEYVPKVMHSPTNPRKQMDAISVDE